MMNWEKVKLEGWPSKTPGQLRILSIDGGGIRGVFPAKYLSLLEKETGHQVFEMFDLLVGTSTGGIIALALAAGIPAKSVLGMYVDNAQAIFGTLSPASRLLARIPKVGRFITKIGVFAPKYDNSGLDRLLRETFGTLEIRDAKTMLCIPAVEHHKASPTVFKTPHHQELYRDGEMFMYEAALATSAAPTYFEPYVRDTECKIDGGLWANCPVMVGIAEAVKNRIGIQDLHLLSLGTGEYPYDAKPEVAKRSSAASYALRAVSLSMSLQMQSSLNMGRYLLGENLVRISCTPTHPVDLDSTSPDDIDMLIREADMQFRDTFRKGPCVESRFCAVDREGELSPASSG